MSPLEPHYILANPGGGAIEDGALQDGGLADGLSDGAAPAEPAPGLLARTVAALQSQGRMVATNWDLETFEVLPLQDDGESTVGVVMSSSRSVVFYGVWPDSLDREFSAETTELVMRANTKLYTCAFELDVDRGLLSVRSGLQIGEVAVDPATLGGLLVNALEEVESVWADFQAAVAAVTSGRSTAEQALREKRNSPST